MKPYYQQSIGEVLQNTKSSANGLTQKEAEDRLKRQGKNLLTEARMKNRFLQFLEQFRDPMVIVLLFAAVISSAIALSRREYGELLDGGVIFFIVCMNAFIGFLQERKAEAAMNGLKNRNKPFVKVYRDKVLTKIPSEDLVTGDLVLLEAGDEIPADIRLTESHSLKAEESALTGESFAEEKKAELCFRKETPIGDRKNFLYSSGTVTYGRGKGIVCETGMRTEMGKIAQLLTAEPEDTPLQKQLAKTAKVLSIAVLAIAAVIFAAAVLQKDTILNAFMTAVAIAVAAIPEGLPAVVTIVLALGVQSMSRRNAIVKHLPSVETLGSCEVICSDKTGTLTMNRMEVKRLYEVGSGIFGAEKKTSSRYLQLGICLCNDAELTEKGELGDPTEIALLRYLTQIGCDPEKLREDHPLREEKPFDSERKLMTSIRRFGAETVSFTKGAPDILLDRCVAYEKEGERIPMTEKVREEIRAANTRMGRQALRVLAVAMKTEALEDCENGLTFLGLAGMMDPPRPEVYQAVKTCKKAGMKAVMITGDHKETAAAVARETGILQKGDLILTGAELDAMTDERLKQLLPSVSVFARVSPENKVRIVNAFRSLNKIVAMTGDGVNDAPSIQCADIGIGMGQNGTDVSKNAADIVLADDNFATIIAAVEEGRKVFSNIKKAIQYLLSANIAEVLCLFLVTVCFGWSFLTPVMILWVNLVTDSLPALGLGMEKTEKDVMDEPPRKNASNLFSGSCGKDILLQGVMQTALVLLSYFLGRTLSGVRTDQTAMTMAFVTLCLIQLFHSYNLRFERRSLFESPLSNRFLNFSFLAGVILTVCVVAVPFLRPIFGTAALSPLQWGVCWINSFLILPFVELQKAVKRRAEEKGKISFRKRTD